MIKEHVEGKLENNPSSQIKNNKNFKKLHAQRQERRWHNKFALCWAFYCVNNENDIKERSPQIMQFESFVTIVL
jgi:hypothetical protein